MNDNLTAVVCLAIVAIAIIGIVALSGWLRFSRSKRRMSLSVGAGRDDES